MLTSVLVTSALGLLGLVSAQKLTVTEPSAAHWCELIHPTTLRVKVHQLIRRGCAVAQYPSMGVGRWLTYLLLCLPQQP